MIFDSYTNGIITAKENNSVVYSKRKEDVVALQKSERVLKCVADEEADFLTFTNKDIQRICSVLNITADDSISKAEAEVKAVCYAPNKEQADKILENLSITADVIKSDGKDKTVYFKETGDTASLTELTHVYLEYNIRVPKTVKDISVNVTIGNININKFSGALSLKTRAGNISLNNCNFEQSEEPLKLITESGNISVKHCIFYDGTAQFEANTGNIFFEDNVLLKKKITLISIAGNITITANVGNGLIEATTFTGNLNVDVKDEPDFRGGDFYPQRYATYDEYEIRYLGNEIIAKVLVGNFNLIK